MNRVLALLLLFFSWKKLSRPKAERTESAKRVIIKALEGFRIIFSTGIPNRRDDNGVNFPMAASNEINERHPKKFLKKLVVQNKAYRDRKKGIIPM